jgi:aspartyl-tRNA(Asn)/glutamyl-tRNA(Gln) amidotransferase subunit B
MSWEPVIGLEVHVQLATATKLFCGCPVVFGAPANVHTCAVCAGGPGGLPVLNREAVARAVRVALALGGEVQARSRFARKHYRYADLPKGYQITQADEPFCKGGFVALADGRRVPLERIHLEEDAGKAQHDRGPYSLVDLNRAGVPLIEIVTLPELDSATEALDTLRGLRELVRWLGAGRADMEKGELRCDVNVSVRRPGEALRTRVEVKNLNSFRHVEGAIGHEFARQVAVYEAGGQVVRQTRRFDPKSGHTGVMRDKEEVRDYRFFCEPDLPPLQLDSAFLEQQRAWLPELPAARRARFRSQLGLSNYDATVLTAERSTSEWFEAVVRAGAGPKAAANWVTNELASALADEGVPAATLDELPCTPRDLATLLALVEAGGLSAPAARRVFTCLVTEGGDPRALVERLGLGQVDDPGAVEAWCRAAIEADPAAADAVRAGKTKALGALIGPVMAASAGRASPGQVRAALQRLLDEA